MTLESFAELTGYHWITIWRMEKEKMPISPRVLAMIAQIQKGERSQEGRAQLVKRKEKGQGKNGRKRS